jgi:tetratricopeptide (TPR) repeat protein
MEERNLEPVLARFRDDLKKNPSDVNALYGLAVVQARMGQMKEAADTITAALRYAPEDPDILRDAGIIAFEVGRTTEAVQYLRKAYQSNDADAETILYLGRAYEQTGDYITALELYRKALAANVADDQLYFGLATAYGQLNNPGESHYYFGVFFKKKNKKDSALFHYRAALSLFPADSERNREIRQEIENLQKPAMKAGNAQAPQERPGPSGTGRTRRMPF